MKSILLSLFVCILPLVTAVELTPYDADGSVTFVIKNFGLNTDGEIKGLRGRISWDPQQPQSAVFNVTVNAATINTGIDMRDEHLRKEEYFDVARYPTIQFVSTAVTATEVTGNLLLKGVTRSISFPYKVTAANGYYLFEGSFTINRKDFGIGGGSVSLGSTVTVNLKVRAKQA